MNDLERKLVDIVDAMREEIVQFLVDLVRAESVNPPGNTLKVVKVVTDKLDSFGVDYLLDSPEQDRPSIVAELNPGGRPRLLYNSHMDTVPIGDMTQWDHDPFGAQIIDGNLYGRGSGDAKGCLAAMVMAAKGLSALGVELKGNLILNPVSDEEAGGLRGVKYMIDKGYLDADMVVIGEMTSNQIAVTHRGLIWFRLTTHGRTAHASTPWVGVNAIIKMLAWLRLIEERVAGKLATMRDPLTPPPSINIATISGGVKTNVVPDRCEVTIDRRTLPDETLTEAEQQIRDLKEELEKADPDFRAEMEVLLTGSPLQTPEGAQIVDIAQAACSELGLPTESVGYQQASDGRFFSEQGIPTLLLGPGIPELAHAPNEYVRVENVIEASKIYALIAAKALS